MGKTKGRLTQHAKAIRRTSSVSDALGSTPRRTRKGNLDDAAAMDYAAAAATALDAHKNLRPTESKPVSRKPTRAGSPVDKSVAALFDSVVKYAKHREPAARTEGKEEEWAGAEAATGEAGLEAD